MDPKQRLDHLPIWKSGSAKHWQGAPRALNLASGSGESWVRQMVWSSLAQAVRGRYIIFREIEIIIRQSSFGGKEQVGNWTQVFPHGRHVPCHWVVPFASCLCYQYMLPVLNIRKYFHLKRYHIDLSAKWLLKLFLHYHNTHIRSQWICSYELFFDNHCLFLSSLLLLAEFNSFWKMNCILLCVYRTPFPTPLPFIHWWTCRLSLYLALETVIHYVVQIAWNTLFAQAGLELMEILPP